MTHDYSNCYQWVLSLLFTIAICVFIGSDCQAQSSSRQHYYARKRAQIRSMPILQRPSRPFHFYGNAVRRNAAQRYGSNRTSSAVPQADSWPATSSKQTQATTTTQASSMKASVPTNIPAATMDTARKPDPAGRNRPFE